VTFAGPLADEHQASAREQQARSEKDIHAIHVERHVEIPNNVLRQV